MLRETGNIQPKFAMWLLVAQFDLKCLHGESSVSDRDITFLLPHEKKKGKEKAAVPGLFLSLPTDALLTTVQGVWLGKDPGKRWACVLIVS